MMHMVKAAAMMMRSWRRRGDVAMADVVRMMVMMMSAMMRSARRRRRSGMVMMPMVTCHGVGRGGGEQTHQQDRHEPCHLERAHEDLPRLAPAEPRRLNTAAA
jgi:hypothetical protein